MVMILTMLAMLPFCWPRSWPRADTWIPARLEKGGHAPSPAPAPGLLSSPSVSWMLRSWSVSCNTDTGDSSVLVTLFIQ